MKKLILLVMVLSVMAGINGFAANSSFAQVTDDSAQSKESKTIFDFKEELALKDEQENKLKAIMFDRQNSVAANTVKLRSLGSELNQMITEKADLKIIKSKLEEIAKIQVTVSYEDVETSREVEKVLTPLQLTQWKGIQKSATQEAIAVKPQKK